MPPLNNVSKSSENYFGSRSYPYWIYCLVRRFKRISGSPHTSTNCYGLFDQCLIKMLLTRLHSRPPPPSMTMSPIPWYIWCHLPPPSWTEWVTHATRAVIKNFFGMTKIFAHLVYSSRPSALFSTRVVVVVKSDMTQNRWSIYVVCVC